jgi:hypothetical protein
MNGYKSGYITKILGDSQNVCESSCIHTTNNKDDMHKKIEGERSHITLLLTCG